MLLGKGNALFHSHGEGTKFECGMHFHMICRFCCVVICLLLSVGHGVVAQMRPLDRKVDRYMETAQELRRVSMHDASRRMLEAVNEYRTDNGTLSESKDEGLLFESLVTGLSLQEYAAVDRSKQFIQFSENKLLSGWLSFQLGSYYFNRGEYPDALIYLELTDALYFTNSENELIQFQKAVSYFSQRKFDNAKPYFRSIQQMPDGQFAADATYYLGCIHLNDREFKTAISLFESIRQHPRYGAVASYHAGLASYQIGAYASSLQATEAYLKSDDSSFRQEARSLVAALNYELHRYSEAVYAFNQLFQDGSQPDELQAFQWGISCFQMRQFREAIRILEPLSSNRDTLARNAVFVLANAYTELKQYNKAWSSYQLCISQGIPEPRLEQSRFNHATLSFELGYLDRGVASMESFLRDYPRSSYAEKAKVVVLEHYAKTNNFKLALKGLADVPSSLSGASDALIARIYFGRALELLQELSYEASTELLQRLEDYPQTAFYAPSLFWRAELAFRKEKYQQSIELMQRFVRNFTQPEGAAHLTNAYYTLGYAQFELEEYAKAAVYFDKLHGRETEEELRRESILRSADCAFMLRNYSRSKQLYTRIKDENGFGTDYAYFQLALIEGIRSVPAKIELLKAMEMRFPQSDYRPLLFMEMADTYMSEEEFGTAVSYLAKISSLVDADDEMIPDSKLKTGICLLNLERYAEALEYFGELMRKYPSSGYASEALDNARSVYIEKRDINGFQSFLADHGKSISALQKDSLYFQVIRESSLEGPSAKAFQSIAQYEQEFPSGIFIADVLSTKAELYVQDKNWKEAAAAFDALAQKGTTKYQERALRQAGKLYFFELKSYASALRQFDVLARISVKTDAVLEALRGAVRCHYYLSTWNDGVELAQQLLDHPSAGEDDRSYAQLLLGHARLNSEQWEAARRYFEQCALSRISALAAQPRYYISYIDLKEGKLEQAEKSCLQSIERSGSNDQWVVKTYVLLSRVFLAQGDYFNARATIQSVLDQELEAGIRSEAQNLLNEIQRVEQKK